MKKIYILHGWAYSTDKWGNFTELLEKGGFKVELLTIPGLTEKTDKVWTLDNYVSWFEKKLDEKAILLGHSNGGRIAIAFAHKHPQKLSNLILIDSAGIYHNELRVRLKRFVFGTAAKMGKKITSSEKLKTLLYKFAGEADYKNANAQMKQTMVNLISVDLKSKLSEISIPTLIIWGSDDKSTPLSDGKLMHQSIKNSKLHVIKNAKHSPQFTNPDEVSQKIIEELK